jgi:hypothetical protein
MLFLSSRDFPFGVSKETVLVSLDWTWKEKSHQGALLFFQDWLDWVGFCVLKFSLG